MQIKLAASHEDQCNTILLIQDITYLSDTPLHADEQKYLSSHYQPEKRDFFVFNRYSHFVMVQIIPEGSDAAGLEYLRKKGDKSSSYLRREKQDKAILKGFGASPEQLLAFAEGFALGSYEFAKHKTPPKDKIPFLELSLDNEVLSASDAEQLDNLVRTCYHVRDLVNEPANMLDAIGFAGKMVAWGTQAGAQVTVLGKKEITELGMEALLTVNKGSISEPSFTIMEWKPEGAVNEKPVVLVGKGLVYDTGGINLKPGSGLEGMKSDMAGGAAVFGAISALALNRVPVYVVGLIPATDNRPGENAMVPGDIIRMGNGKTIEIANTDAEGRLILADALLYAQRYDPIVVINIATLTGAAVVAIGRHGIAAMQQGAGRYMEALKESGMQVYERIAELPFWEEYDEDIRSDVADIRNISKNRGGGTITAGKFLAHFTSYPFIHLDIATMAYLDSNDSYRGKGGTAAGVRLLYHFLAGKHFDQ